MGRQHCDTAYRISVQSNKPLQQKQIIVTQYMYRTDLRYVFVQVNMAETSRLFLIMLSPLVFSVIQPFQSVSINILLLKKMTYKSTLVYTFIQFAISKRQSPKMTQHHLLHQRGKFFYHKHLTASLFQWIIDIHTEHY